MTLGRQQAVTGAARRADRAITSAPAARVVIPTLTHPVVLAPWKTVNTSARRNDGERGRHRVRRTGGKRVGERTGRHRSDHRHTERTAQLACRGLQPARQARLPSGNAAVIRGGHPVPTTTSATA